ncbi:MAG: NAD(P) transhydrogenase subunit alpha [Crocinitomicaceae bacterium]|nr:NAD(P) transhydrogenase subunit alpha [Crocinitomicaceae bacterium]
MTESIILTQIDGLYIVVLALLLGIEVIKNVPAVLHTPLMSGANAISGIIVVGATIHLLNAPEDDYLNLGLSTLAVLLGTINIAGGFFITHRMLSMFSKPKKNNNQS